MPTLTEMATDVLNTADGRTKTAISRKYAAMWREARAAGEPIEIGTAEPPMQPARRVRRVIKSSPVAWRR